MALFYKNQGKVEKLSVKTGIASYRMSDQRQILYGGRGAKYDELVYLRGQNGSVVGVDRYESDSWAKFGAANGAPGSRADQIERDFTVAGAYP